jgi:hypothetical protein
MFKIEKFLTTFLLHFLCSFYQFWQIFKPLKNVITDKGENLKNIIKEDQLYVVG